MAFYTLITWTGDDVFAKYVADHLSDAANRPNTIQAKLVKARTIALMSVSKRERLALREAMEKNTLGVPEKARYRGALDIGQVFAYNPPKPVQPGKRRRAMSTTRILNTAIRGAGKQPLFGKLARGVMYEMNKEEGSSRIGFLRGKMSEKWQERVADLQAGDFSVFRSFADHTPSSMRRYWGAMGMPLGQEKELMVPARQIFEPIMDRDDIPSLLEARMIRALEEMDSAD